MKLYESAKAFVATIVTAVTGVVALIQVAVADKAISLDEAQGIWLAITVAIGTIVAAYAVWRTPNKPAAGGSA